VPAAVRHEPSAAKAAGGRPAASAGTGLIVAAGMALALAVTGRPGPAVALLVVATAANQLLQLRPGVGRVVEVVVSGIANVVSVVLLTLVGLFVLVPVWVVGRVLRWDALAPSADERARWRAHARRSASTRRTFAREHWSVTWADRLHAGAVGAVVLLLAAGVGVVVVRTLRPEGGSQAASVVDQATALGALAPTPDGLAHPLVAHEGDEWAPDLFREELDLDNVYDPYLTYVVGDHAGTYINVDDLERRSYVPDAVDGEAPEVWFFGGSALFGIGQRDEHTIPSEVARIAAGQGVPVRVRNFGASGYVNWQEVLLLSRLVVERGAPDLVVFYDGANDVAAYARRGDGGGPTTLFADEVADALEESRLVTAVEDEGEPDSGRYADVFYEGDRLARDLGRGEGFPVAHFFQPSLGTKTLTEDDQAVLDSLGWDDARFAQEQGWWDEAEAQVRAPIIPLFDVLDDADEPIDTDQVHTDEEGARLVAEAVWDHLEPTLAALADGGPSGR
jgi:lysophospholipase L1-like esterase